MRDGSRKLRPSVCYLICCSERTGSTLLSDALLNTGIAGRPHGYFSRVALYNPRTRRILREMNDDNYLDKVVAAATTPNGVFGAKVHWEHFVTLAARAGRFAGARDGEVAALVPEVLEVPLPNLHYIWLARKNEVARAISHYRAKKTDRWHVDSRWTTDDSEGEPDFDFHQIDAFVRLGKGDELRWRQFFRDHNIVPLELFYEELIGNLEEAVRRVLEFIGIPGNDVKLPPPTLRKMADDRSLEWEVRYRRICADGDE
jgi:LPS sulfotransferase NodH